jgi:hypothetical protein
MADPAFEIDLSRLAFAFHGDIASIVRRVCNRLFGLLSLRQGEITSRLGENFGEQAGIDAIPGQLEEPDAASCGADLMRLRRGIPIRHIDDR